MNASHCSVLVKVGMPSAINDLASLTAVAKSSSPWVTARKSLTEARTCSPTSVSAVSHSDSVGGLGSRSSYKVTVRETNTINEEAVRSNPCRAFCSVSPDRIPAYDRINSCG